MENRDDLFDAVILDIDGTIWNTTGIVAVAWNRVIDRNYSEYLKENKVKHVVAQDLQKEFGKTMDVIARDLWPQLPEEVRQKLMADCCSEEHTEIEQNTLDITYSGVVETVKELSSCVNFYVVSNCQSGYIELTLSKTGLTEFVKDGECFGRTGKGKAENLQLLITRNEIKNPIYVGDTEGDRLACLQANVPFVWASYGFGTPEKYFEKLEEFSDLKNLFLKNNQ